MSHSPELHITKIEWFETGNLLLRNVKREDEIVNKRPSHLNA